MSIKLADLAAREALLDVEETGYHRERKSESKPCVVSQNCCYAFCTTDHCKKSASLEENDGS